MSISLLYNPYFHNLLRLITIMSCQIGILQARHKLRYLPTTIQRSIPFHISNYKFLAENHPDIHRADRNENQVPDRLAVGHFEATRHEIKK